MRDVWLRISGILLAAAGVYLFLSVIQTGFIPMMYAVYPVKESLVSTEKTIAQGVSNVLWSLRSIDLIVLALLLFLAFACCASILAPRREVRRR